MSKANAKGVQNL